MAGLRDYFDEECRRLVDKLGAGPSLVDQGFTEPPAFFKAFKRWTGMTPREFQHGAVG